MSSSRLTPSSIKERAGRSWTFSEAASGSTTSSLLHESSRAAQTGGWSSESLSTSSSPPESAASIRLQPSGRSRPSNTNNSRSSSIASSLPSRQTVDSSHSSSMESGHRDKGQGSPPFSLSQSTLAPSMIESSKELRISSPWTPSRIPTLGPVDTVVCGCGNEEEGKAEERPQLQSKSIPPANDSKDKEAAGLAQAESSTSSGNYEDDEFEDFSDAAESTGEGFSEILPSDRYSEDSFESYTSASHAPRIVTFPAMPGPLLPAPKRWPPKEQPTGSRRSDRLVPEISQLLRRLALKQEEDEAAAENKEMQALHAEAMREPILEELHRRLEQRTLDCSDEWGQPPRKAVWRDVIQARPVSEALVNRLALRNLAQNLRALIEESRDMQSLAACKLHPVPAEVAASAFLRKAINRTTSHCVEIKLRNEWDSIVLEEKLHPVPLAGEASREYLQAKAARQPQAPEDLLTHAGDAHRELLRAAERSRLLRGAAEAVLSRRRPVGSGAAALAAENVDDSPLFMPCSSWTVLAGPSQRAAACVGQDESDEFPGEELADPSVMLTIATSRDLRNRAAQVLGGADGQWSSTAAGALLHCYTAEATFHSAEPPPATNVAGGQVTPQTLAELLQESKQLQVWLENQC
eukprot:CAMPEP_0117648194 /NCGR_PEP_ID=MMETSP0804-20121206/260_1 /TAXON_ID=1074897 /ORGANISM="Tetraselmis astigmatica, Strain CCMP880" /LENGTH=635 /DNA_ID=CAMNT_0005453751 /DNA_START=210 /DNA_END=2117 /DNA_ORIENTATION=+